MLRLRRLQYLKFTFKQYLDLKQKKQFRTILNVSKDSKYEQLRSNFFQLIKEYHPDKNILNPNFNKGECEQITKIITEAYSELTNQYMKNRGEDTKMYERANYPETQEDKIYHEVFKKHRYQDPYAFYRPENDHLKKIYLQKIEEMKSKTSENKNFESTQQSFSKQTKSDNKKISSLIPYLIGVSGALAALLYYFYLPKHQEVNLKQITDDQIDSIEKKWKAKLSSKAENIREQYQSEQAPALDWHTYGLVPVLDQLFKYSIYQDLQLFEVQPTVFDNKEFQFSQGRPTMCRLNKMRLNTLISLSLEAERCLQNIYVSREYLLDTLKQKGYFECPGIFMRFYGYLYFKLRPKKLNLQNFKGQKWISLFDIYYKYYNPTSYYADYFDTHFTKERQPQYFGDIHLNTRTLPLHHLKPDQKNVYMWAPKGGDYKPYEQKYKSIWTNYYSFYSPAGANYPQ